MSKVKAPDNNAVQTMLFFYFFLQQSSYLMDNSSKACCICKSLCSLFDILIVQTESVFQ